MTVVIVGSAVRVPGAGSPSEMWDLLANGHDVSSETPLSRYDAKSIHSARVRPGHVVSERGYYLDDVAGFDSEFFGIESGAADLMDPQQRIMLELVWEALEDAGIRPETLRGSRTGVFVGSAHTDYWDLIVRDGLDSVPGGAVANVRSLLSGLISYHFDFRGPALTLDTACSSSLVGMHLARRSLLSGDADVCVVGGVNLKLHGDLDVVLSQIPALSTDGKCRFGDAHAGGFVSADGAGVVVLRRRDDAVDTGNRIRAVIRSSVVTNDGARGGSPMSPSVDAHVEMLEEALRDSELTADDVDFIECHGPGAPLIDRMELAALDTVFGSMAERGRPLYAGSVKTNFGHAEGAAGVVGVVKALQCLEHRSVVPSLHVNQLNPVLDWSSTSVCIPSTTITIGREDKPILCGISGQGISSVNAHVLVEEFASDPSGGFDSAPNGICVLVSARTLPSLRALVRNYRDRISRIEERREIIDIAWTSCVGREPMANRVAFIADSAEGIVGHMDSWLSGEGAAAAVLCDSDTAGDLRTAATRYCDEGDAESIRKLIPRGQIGDLPFYAWDRTYHWKSAVRG